jgi:serine/threonine protein kinase/WD40 repeat protein
MDGLCVNQNCTTVNSDAMLPFGSLSPDDMTSMDPSQVVDYTGTIGVAPDEFGSAFAQDSLVADDDDSAQTRMVDDNFYKQIQEFFPADSGSKSAKADSSAPESSSRSHIADASRSISLRSDRSNYSVGEFVPPVRDIRFPSDTASLEQIREMEAEDIEGDEYHIVEKLGEGGYGIVFEAEQTALNRPVAIKVLKPKRKKPGSKSKGPSRTGTGTGELQRRRDQFLHEAKITARLQHPNIVPLYDFGINSTGQLFYSMKKVQRRPWSDVLHKPARLLNIAESDVDELATRQAISRNIEIFSRVCDAMAYSHSMNVVHRDLKPDNIMIGDYGEVLLIDFGMALDLSGDSREFSAGGTLVYMAPEMAEHFAKQKEIQVAAQKTAKRLGMEKGTVFLDQTNLVGIGSLAQKLIRESEDRGVVELAETLIRLDSEEKKLAGKIGYSSDIYLLGAILYQIAVGHPPHYFPLAACKKGGKEKFQKELWLASRNGFQQYTQITDPLLLSLRAIAVQAMRTSTEDRFKTVEELQEAIRGFQLQVQSMELTETGKEELDKAKGREDYQHLLPALEAFRGAGELWPDSVDAPRLQKETACEYANRAHDRKDFDAGLSILDEYVLQDQQQEEPVVEAREKLNKGKKVRARNRKLAIAGWIATLVIPIIAIGAAVPIINTARTATKRLEAIKPELAAANETIANAKRDAAREVQNIQLANQERITKINKENALKIAKSIKDNEAEMDKANAENKLAMEQAARINKEKIAAANRANEKKIKDNNDKAARQVAAEIKKAEIARIKAEKFQFDADFGEYNANVLTIPLDLRTSKLDQAKAKLKNLRSSDETKPQFKNGWLVRHFAKRLGAGTSVQLSDGAQIIDLVTRPNSDDSLAIGLDQGEPAVWNVTSEGVSSKLNLELPTVGQIADASVSNDGAWLGLAVNSVAGEGANAVLVSLNDGSRIVLPDASVERLAGCRNIQFADDAGDQLIVVEEIKGHFDLKQRVHVVQYRIEGSELEEVSRTEIAATERNEGRVEYLANVRWNDGQPVTAIAFESLSKDRAEVIKLQIIAGTKAMDAVSAERFPTALLVGQQDKLFCGHRDGTVEFFDINNLAKPAQTLTGENANDAYSHEGSFSASLVQSDDGRLFSGAENGKIAIWSPQLSFFKEVDDQQGQLSSLAIAGIDQRDGLMLLSGDRSGSLNVWRPETGKNDAVIDKGTSVTVNCGAVDQGLFAGEIPATAFGTASGNVFYFDSRAMIDRSKGKSINENADGVELGATFRFSSPFKSFDNAFNDFDSMGIVEDYFVVLKDNGTLFTALVDENENRKNFPSSFVKSFSVVDEDPGDYIPLMGSTHNRNYFFTNDPADATKLLHWNRSGKEFVWDSVETGQSGKYPIKRLAMSNDGQWLAVVRLDGETGEYFAEIFDVSSGSKTVALATQTERYRVGDPAFIGFSDDSQTMLLHGHKTGTERETWVDQWNLSGSQWARASNSPRRTVTDRKVDVIDWSNAKQVDQLVTRLNRKFYLNRLNDDAQKNSQDEFSNRDLEGRLRNVLSARKADQFYVLATNSLAQNNGLKQVGKANEYQLQNARDMRVFGGRVVVLDQKGFHLFDNDLNYVSMLASRKPEVAALSLSQGRLAIQYDNQLCRVWDVSGETPTGVGRVDGVENSQLSPDGKWIACQVGDAIKVFSVDGKFDAPVQSIPRSGGVFHWNGKNQSKLILAAAKDNSTQWSEIDPATGAEQIREDLPSAVSGITDFALAPITENFVAIEQKLADGKETLAVWATDSPSVQMNKLDHEFDAAGLGNIASISFSEIGQDDPTAIGTRMAVLASKDAKSKLTPRIYLLAKQTQKPEAGDAADGPADPAQSPAFRYRVVEIEGALQSSRNDALKLKDLKFSGDGKTLIQVHDKGTQTLLSQKNDGVAE